MRGPPILLALALAGCDEPPLSADAARGEDLARTAGCGSCHRIPGMPGADGLAGPPLDAMNRQPYVAGVIPNTPKTLALFIRDPQAVDPRSAMPDLGLDADQAAALAAWLIAVGERS